MTIKTTVTSLSLAIILLGCATSPPKPILYPNAYFNQVGQQVANHDIASCMSMAHSSGVNEKKDGEIGKMKINGGKYAVANMELAPDEFENAWETIYGEWLPKSGYQPDDKPCYELYLNDPETHPEKKCIVDIHIPVKPL